MGVIPRLVLILTLTAGMIANVPSVALAAPEDVEFEGSGWGHGVGMSQYGAYAMDTLGYTYGEILAHYYQGTSLDSVSSTATIWVNLEQNFTTKSLTVLNVGGGGGTSVSIESDSGSASAEPGATIGLAAAGANGCSVEVTNPAEDPVTITDESDCSVDFSWYDWSTPGNDPTTKIQIAGCSLADWNTPGGTVFRPCQYGRGQLHLRHGSGGLDLSAEMLLDDYVYGISEMPYGWPAEALKTQAVAARSYAESRKITRGDPTSSDDNGCWCHVRDTTSDQRYVGWGHTGVASWISAADATASQVITHPDSSIGSLGVVTAFYSSSSGGATEYGHLKGFASSSVEWLSSVDDSWAVDGTVSNPNASWTVTKSPETVADAADLDLVLTMSVSKTRAGSGSVSEVELEGALGGELVTVTKSGSWVRLTFGLKSEYFTVDWVAPPEYTFDPPGDEILLYRTDGTFQYNSLLSEAKLGIPLLTGSSYTPGWGSITSLDLDGDGQDEIMFYRDDGLYRYYEIGQSGHLGSPLQAGDDYTSGWSSITSVDLDGDGQDEAFFYRDDGLYRFYNVRPGGRIGSPIRAGDDYTSGWDSISAVDLDGDGQDEMFFYRSDGLYRYYNIQPDGRIGSPIRAGDDYTSGWDSITAVDLDGDGQDEMFFYRDDGLYRFYNVKSTATLGSPIGSGNDFSPGWSVLTPINLDGE